jgi:hypothetical protein
MVKPSFKADDALQYKRFRDFAAELGVEEGGEKALERAVKKLAKAPRPEKKGRETANSSR